MTQPRRQGTELRVESLRIPTAPLGPDNPLPPVFAPPPVHEVTDLSSADEEMVRGVAFGRVGSVLPYLMRDDYDRDRHEVDHRVVVLENEHLRATFLVALGGRLWSLVDKATDRELLHRNAILQPANLALRGAWFAGGVEWNIGTIGHSPTTCEPLHAARIELPDGTSALRMYEFERLREVVFQIDAWLPEDSRVLLVRVRITNPNDHTVPMYWWSNIAVPETAGVRVVAPADRAWQFTYAGSLRTVPVPECEGADLTYPARAGAANDYFFDVAGSEGSAGSEAQLPWVAAVGADGNGLFQASTARLRGRKLFLWGRGQGGRNWQQWLSGPDHAYFEIQAGLARTQLEHLPMPAGAQWSWLEAYGSVTGPLVAVHGDWDDARAAVGGAVRDALSGNGFKPVASHGTTGSTNAAGSRESCTDLEATLAAAEVWVDSPPTEVFQQGSGWGHLEQLLRLSEGDKSLDLVATPFAASTLTEHQADWIHLLERGAMPAHRGVSAPFGYQRSERWLRHLETGHGWREPLHRGVIEAAVEQAELAELSWRASWEHTPNPWAARNLAVLARRDGDLAGALALLRDALVLLPAHPALTRELVDTLLEAGDAAGALLVIEAAPDDVRARGRIQLARVRALVAVGDLSQATDELSRGLVVPDIREGEPALHEVWFEAQAAIRARSEGRVADDRDREFVRRGGRVPRNLDLRMTPAAETQPV